MKPSQAKTGSRISSMVKYLAAAASHHALPANSVARGGAALVCHVGWDVVVFGRLGWQRARHLMLMRRSRNAITGRNNARLEGNSSDRACSRRRGLRYCSVFDV